MLAIQVVENRRPVSYGWSHFVCKGNRAYITFTARTFNGASTACSAGCRADLSRNIVGNYKTGLYNYTDLHEVVHISLNSPAATTSIGTQSVEGTEYLLTAGS